MRIIPFKEPLKSCCENYAIYSESKEEISFTEFIIQEFCTVIFILWSHRNSRNFVLVIYQSVTYYATYVKEVVLICMFLRGYLGFIHILWIGGVK